MQKDLSKFVWKGNKELDLSGKYVQKEVKLVDMNLSELNQCYEHCKTMLYNKDPKNPGRYNVLNIIEDQRNRCGVELFLRFLQIQKEIPRFTLVSSLNEWVKNNPTIKKPLIEDVLSNFPVEYNKIPISLVIDGCLDKLGVFNKKHITRTFILKQGIWSTAVESKEINDRFEGKVVDKIEVIREDLRLKDVEKIYPNSKGLNYSQMRAMITLRPNKKYVDLTTLQLETLRNRILFSLEETVSKHIIAWEERMLQIEQVMNVKMGINEES